MKYFVNILIPFFWAIVINTSYAQHIKLGISSGELLKEIHEEGAKLDNIIYQTGDTTKLKISLIIAHSMPMFSRKVGFTAFVDRDSISVVFWGIDNATKKDFEQISRSIAKEFHVPMIKAIKREGKIKREWIFLERKNEKEDRIVVKNQTYFLGSNSGFKNAEVTLFPDHSIIVRYSNGKYDDSSI